ncbi:MAG: isopropylmalate isomerase [Pseudomonadota bacterium]|nr:isopropylmalate isomerase [Sphingomonas sp.]MBA3835510.1 isopropylmalate isomerase [Sphingomonas sp.]MDQ3482238.1 isopropylmalate isomerase [Pseudomonadota bacterium]
MSDRDDDTDKTGDERRQKLRKAGVTVGIGSAAIVAALLYASNVKKKPKKKPANPVPPERGGATD